MCFTCPGGSGDSFVRVLRVREAPGDPDSNGPKAPGGSARKDLTRAGGGEGGWGSGVAHLYVFYVS